MISFFSSLGFLFGAIMFALAMVAIAILRVNTLWAPRGITPKEQVDELKGGTIEALFTSKKVLYVLGGATALLLIVWGISIFSPKFDMKLSLPDSPSLRSVAEVAINNWLPVWIVYLATIVFLTHKKQNGWKGVDIVQSMLTGIMIVFFIILPFWSWFMPSRQSGEQATALQGTIQTTPQYTPPSLPQPRAWNPDGSIRDIDAWKKELVPGNGKSPSVSPLYPDHVVWGGTGFTVHCGYTDGHEEVSNKEHVCSDGVASTWVTNNGPEPVPALYAFAGKGEK